MEKFSQDCCKPRNCKRKEWDECGNTGTGSTIERCARLREAAVCATAADESRPRDGSERGRERLRRPVEHRSGSPGVAGRSGARHGAAVAARMCARSEAVELEVLGAEGEARVPPRPLRLSLLELLGKLVRRDQPAPPTRRARHNHRFRTFVPCGLYLSITSLRYDPKISFSSLLTFHFVRWSQARRFRSASSIVYLMRL